MSCFRVNLQELQTESEKLEEARRTLDRSMTEIDDIVRSLNALSGFTAVRQRLRQYQQRGWEQAQDIHQCARVLLQAANLYHKTEIGNVNSGGKGAGMVQQSHNSYAGIAYACGTPIRLFPFWRPYPMLLNARALFRMVIVIKALR